MYNRIIIGIDQSYTRSGISIAADGKLLKVSSEAFKGCKNKSDKRLRIITILDKLIPQALSRASEVAIICERIRTFSHNHNVQQATISTSYIKATGALFGAIVDVAYKYGVKVFSVDTRSWKSKVVGTSKGEGTSEIANKIPTIKYVCRLGFEEVIVGYNRKGTKVYDDDAADSACIALYGFVPKGKRNLQLEE